jgi:hypothetical protein
VLQTQILWPDQHPGLPPGEDPGGEADRYPPGHRWRVLVMQAGRSEDPSVRRKLLKVAQRVIDTVRPITNALAGGDPAQPDPALPRTYPNARVVPAPATTGPRP